jgi:hypothetical protein
MDVGEIVRRSPWGLAVVALLGLSGCLPASRGWVAGAARNQPHTFTQA